MKIHKCDACEFTTTQKSNFNRHLKTKKHIRNITNITNSIKQQNICEHCGKSFTTNPHMRRHQLHHCKFNNNEMDLIKIREIKLKKKEKQLLTKMDELMECVKHSNNANITHNSNNYVQQNIVINAFGNEDIKYIKTNFLDNLIKAPFGAIPKLIKAIHFNSRHPENKNVKITNKKQPFASIFKDERWMLKDKKTVINDMIYKGFDLIDEHHEYNKEKLNKFKEKNYNNFRNQYDNDDKELKTRLEKNIEIDILNNS